MMNLLQRSERARKSVICMDALADRPGLLDRLRGAQLDDSRSLMDVVMFFCRRETLLALSAASRRNRKHAHARLRQLEEQHYVEMAHDLARRLADFNSSRCTYDGSLEAWRMLDDVRCLSIPDTLPQALRPMLGAWLRPDGCLAHVTCVRCRFFVQAGEEIGWIDLDSVRTGMLEHMTPEEGLSLDKLDTPDSLLKTVLKHCQE